MKGCVLVNTVTPVLELGGITSIIPQYLRQR